jgi:septal ring factor EnvC (AmiA/AmiB activator)
MIVAVTFSAAGSGRAWAQESPEQLRKMYNDALAQLKSAQERRNALALENERLTAQVAELQTQLNQSRDDLGSLRRAAADWDAKTFFLRCQYAAWQRFIARYPRLAEQWKLFLDANVFAEPSELPVPMDDAEPFLVRAQVPTTQETSHDADLHQVIP